MPIPAIGPSSLAVAPRPGRGGLGGWLAPGLLHALVRDVDGGGVRHYERAQDRPDRSWVRSDLVSPDAVGPGALVVTRGVLHALVPEPGGVAHHVKAALPRVRAGHHTLDPNAWGRRDRTLPGTAVSAATDRGAPLAATTTPTGVEVARLDRDHWVTELMIPGAGAAALASGSLVVERDGQMEWWRWGGDRWRPASVIGAAGSAAPSLVADAGGWLLAVPRGDVVQTWRLGRDGSTTRHATLTWGAGEIAGVTLAPANGNLGPRALHALTDEDGSIFQHRRHAAESAWLRVNCLRLHDESPFTVEEHESTKLAQVSGEVDSQPRREGGRRATLSASRSTAGVLGTDLGVRISHLGEDFLLFGDTHWQHRPWLTTRDAIARIDPTGPIEGLPGFTFHGAPLRVVGGGVTLREYDVPLDGFSLGDDFYAFFTSNHFRHEQVMGRSVLAVHRGPLRADPRSRRPITFRYVRTFSQRHFINVSVQRVPADALGLPGDELLAVWGAGSYRAGDLRLAVLDPTDPAGPAHPASVRYWAGSTEAGQPRWSDREADARPLLHPGAFGEISVRWVPEVGRFLLLACSGPEDPIGLAVTLRTAETPWGPWSPRRRLLDWVARGMWFDDPYSRFIKSLADGDPVGDRIFKAQADATGAAYAPYFFDARPDGDDLVLRYTLSTWNPYQVVLMQHRLEGEVAHGRSA